MAKEKYSTKGGEFGAFMRKYKDKPGPNGNGDMADGAKSMKRDYAKEGQYSKQNYAEKAASAREAAGYAIGTKDRGGVYESGNWNRTAKTLSKMASDEGTAARHKLIAKYNERDTSPNPSPDPHKPNMK